MQAIKLNAKVKDGKIILDVPKEFGEDVEVIILNKSKLLEEITETEKMNNKKEALNKIFNNYKISLPDDYKFDREEANER